MKTKTWKIGEYAKGGVIQANISKTGSRITLIGKDWDFKAGSLKTSDQSNAEEFARLEVYSDNYDVESQLREWLEVGTSVYYADQIMEWINNSLAPKTAKPGNFYFNSERIM